MSADAPVKRHFTHSLRLKVALGVALPVFLALGAFSGLLYLRERQLLLDRLEDTAIRLGEVMRGGLRYAMLTRNQDELRRIITDIGNQESVLRVAIVNADGHVRMVDKPENFAPAPDRSSPGCRDCHRPTGVLQRHSIVVQLPNEGEVLRSSILITNDAECYGCHPSTQPILGVLIADFSLQDLERGALNDLQLGLGISVIITVLITLGVYGLVQWQVVRRVERFQQPLLSYAEGDFSQRVKLGPREQDELGDLALAVNRMAEGLTHQTELERRAREARWNAIVEERQRLSRELHDSLAQVLGYVQTKATAVRLLLNRGQVPEAVSQLQQLEEAAREVFGDLRQAILDLRTGASSQGDFVSTLSEYMVRFREQSGIPTHLLVAPGADALVLLPESEVQLLRIVQEALTNVRKHAQASAAWVQIDPDGGRQTSVIIRDNGRGFDPSRVEHSRPHFGLSSMRERAEAVGGTLRIETVPGAGTRVIVTLPVRPEEVESHGSAPISR